MWFFLRLDAIAEFKVQTSDFSAELGRAAGAVLNATVKSGTNQYPRRGLGIFPQRCARRRGLV